MTPLTVVKVLLALVPRAVIAVIHTTMIRASMTAYSTAVGPSSLRKNARTACATLYMDANPLRFAGRRWTGPTRPHLSSHGGSFVPTGTVEMELRQPAACGGAQRCFHPFGNLATLLA